MSSTIERNILTILDPAIELDELSIPDIDDELQIKLSKFSSLIPIIDVNGYQIQGDRLVNFKLKNTGFYPTMKVIFDDVDSFFMARHFPKDGDIIKLYIRSMGDETTFKPIRIDFTIIDIKPLGGGGNVKANRFMIEGRMYVPNLFTEKVQYHRGTSFDTLLDIAEGLDLGFASNVSTTNDSMAWINPNNTIEKHIQDITAASYLNDDSFFTAYIDPYYCLTFAEVNRFFNQEGEIEVSKSLNLNSGDYLDKGVGEQDFPNILSNLIEMQGNSRYISNYKMINESGLVSKNNGYKRYAQYWDLETKEFVSEFIDPLTFDTPGFINATKGRLIDGQVEGPRNDQVKFKYLGSHSNENAHNEYMYSVVLNYQNLVEVKKLGMIVDLDTVNTAILRYSRIYCQIFEYAEPVKNVLKNPLINKTNTDGTQQERQTNDFENSGIINEFLSGFYVISGIEYILTKPGIIRMRLHLQRREFIPTT